MNIAAKLKCFGGTPLFWLADLASLDSSGYKSQIILDNSSSLCFIIDVLSLDAWCSSNSYTTATIPMFSSKSESW